MLACALKKAPFSLYISEIVGAGAFEVACAADLKKYMLEVEGRQKLGDPAC
jgi:hypothetical protein